jgi:P27 family predicted phage terminase small subunit
MAIRGRKPKPSNLHALHGNPGKRARNPYEPNPTTAVPHCPGRLDTEARREWRRVVRELRTLGLVSKLDRAVLAAYCVAWSRWVALESHLAQVKAKKGVEGLLATARSGYQMPHPLLTVAGMAARTPTAALRISLRVRSLLLPPGILRDAVRKKISGARRRVPLRWSTRTEAGPTSIREVGLGSLPCQRTRFASSCNRAGWIGVRYVSTTLRVTARPDP